MDFFFELMIVAIPTLFAITLHEAAHGYVALQLGDPTARLLGRISINPIRHVDPVGTVLLPLTLFVISRLTHAPLMLIGWAKPVPIDVRRLRGGPKDMGWVAVAGPGANFVMLLAWAMVLRVMALQDPGLPSTEFFAAMAETGMEINGVLMVFNLLPILPLDGGRILVSLLPRQIGIALERLEPYSMWIILLLAFSGSLLESIMRPILFWTLKLAAEIVGL